MDFSLSLCFVASRKRTRDTKGALETLSSNAADQTVVKKTPIERCYRGRARIIADKTKKIGANPLYPRPSAFYLPIH
jgi:hypothetical protein